MKYLAHIGCGLTKRANMIFIIEGNFLSINGFGIRGILELFIEDAIKAALTR